MPSLKCPNGYVYFLIFSKHCKYILRESRAMQVYCRKILFALKLANCFLSLESQNSRNY